MANIPIVTNTTHSLLIFNNSLLMLTEVMDSYVCKRRNYYEVFSEGDIVEHGSRGIP